MGVVFEKLGMKRVSRTERRSRYPAKGPKWEKGERHKEIGEDGEIWLIVLVTEMEVLRGREGY